MDELGRRELLAGGAAVGGATLVGCTLPGHLLAPEAAAASAAQVRRLFQQTLPEACGGHTVRLMASDRAEWMRLRPPVFPTHRWRAANGSLDAWLAAHQREPECTGIGYWRVDALGFRETERGERLFRYGQTMIYVADYTYESPRYVRQWPA